MIKGFPEIFVADNIIMMSATILNIIAIVKLLKSLYVAKKNIIRSYEYKVKAFKDIKLALIADAIIVLLFIIAHIIGGVSIINISAILIVEILPLSIITELVLWRNYRNTNKLKELCAMDTDKLENLEVEQNNNIKTKETIISVTEITIITVISLVVLLNSISIVTVAIGITMSDIIKHNYISMIWHGITILLILITNVFIKNYNPQSIITYCDISKFTGNSYLRLGFKPIQPNPITEPNYAWVKTDLSEIYNEQQDKVDEETEIDDEVMYNLNFLKVYNCGNIRMEWKRDA